MTYTVKILGVPFKVTFVPSWKDVDHDGAADRLYGQISYGRHSIRVAADNPVEQQRRTLMHELIHGVVNALHIRELHDGDGHQLEAPIDQLAVGLAEALESLGLVLPPAEPA